MMDEGTLHAHRHLLSKAAPLQNPAFELLNPNERTAADFTQEHEQGIEQEKQPTAFVQLELRQAEANGRR
jgi:hypothetical protein